MTTTTTETRRPTKGSAKPSIAPSVGAHLPHSTSSGANPSGPPSGGDPNSTVSQLSGEIHDISADRGSTSALDLTRNDAQPAVVEGGPSSAIAHSVVDAQLPDGDGGSNSRQARFGPEPIGTAPAGADAGQDRTANQPVEPSPTALFDPALAFAADILDDTEGLWVANSNRLRILTTPHDQADSDGEYRGFGLTEADADVARLGAMVATLDQLTKDATKHLEKVMRRHPLHPWVKAQKGLGDKQVARLLAAIGDPYWNTLHDRPRTVSELWAYCGLHVLPASQNTHGSHSHLAGRVQAGEGGDPRQHEVDTQCGPAGVAPRRQRGQKSNWSETARKRAWLIANSVVKCGGPYREVYDATKDKYADAVHTSTCVRCGPKGKPAHPGSPLSKAHIHARGLRAISKAVLKDLWIEAKRLHEPPVGDQLGSGGQEKSAADRAP